MLSAEGDRLRNALRGQYDVEAEIGRGGMGIVYRARDITLDRPVAIKTLPAHLATDAVIRERFLREARTAASLSHPGIVPIHRADQVGDLVFFVMGLVHGHSVAQHIQTQGVFAPADAIAVLCDVASALSYAHERGIVHRDIKAENILLDHAQRRAVVTDFGIARVAQTAPMTATGTLLGSVHYMSPEQVNGESLDGRSDLYSLGVLAFHMLTGRFPFEHEAPSAVLVAHVMRSAPAVRSMAPTVPSVLATVVDRLLEKAPGARFGTAAETVSALNAAAADAGRDANTGGSKRVSSADADAIWKRAALLQELTGEVAPPPLPEVRRPLAAPSDTVGFQMDDVVAAGEAAGIDPRYVKRAIAEREPAVDATGLVRQGASMPAEPGKWTAARPRIEFEAVLTGELGDDGFEEIVDAMRRIVGEFGSVARRGRTVEFTSTFVTASGSPRRLQVSVACRNGRTTIRALEDIKSLSRGLLGGVTGGVGGGFGGAAFVAVLGLTHSPLLAIPAFAAVAVSAFGFSRALNRQIEKDKTRDVRDIVTRLSARAQELLNPMLPPG